MHASKLLLLLVGALAGLATCKTQKLALDNTFACDANRCIDGYVCHPETQKCVQPVTVGCDASGALCPADTITGDACDHPGSFLPCSVAVSDCSRGCRTCEGDKTWSTCTAPETCEGVRIGDDCGACENKCLGLPGTQRSKCDVSSGTPTCKVLECKKGLLDSNSSASDGCEGQCAASDICNGLDDDCNGIVDDVPIDVADATCKAANSGAANVAAYVCELGACKLSACVAGTEDTNHSATDGCEGTCVPSNDGVETCDNLDNDCNGTIDDVGPGLCTNYYPDQDGDGFGSADVAAKCTCPNAKPAGHVSNNSDCAGDDNASGNHCPALNGSCSDADGDHYCEASNTGNDGYDCDSTSNNAALCNLDCSDSAQTPECRPTVPTFPPDDLTISTVTGAVNGACRTMMLQVTPSGGTASAYSASRISCTAPAQVIRTFTFETAGLDGFTASRATRDTSTTCKNGTSAVLFPARGGAAGVAGSCNATTCVATGVVGAVQPLARATLTSPNLDLTNWSGITASAARQYSKLTGGLSAKWGCGAAGTALFSSGTNTCAAFAATALPAADNCASLSFAFDGDNTCCDATTTATLDDLLVAGTPKAFANGSFSGTGPLFEVAVTSCAGVDIPKYDCRYQVDMNPAHDLTKSSGVIDFTP